MFANVAMAAKRRALSWREVETQGIFFARRFGMPSGARGQLRCVDSELVLAHSQLW